MARNKPMSSQERREATREERHNSGNKKETKATFLSVSFKYFRDIDGDGQSLNTWRKNNLIDRLLISLHFVTTNSFTHLSTTKVLENYTEFPESSKTKFTCPPDLSKNLDWGVIRSVGGAERIAGFIKNNIFYVVFLDKNHHFYLPKKAR